MLAAGRIPPGPNALRLTMTNSGSGYAWGWEVSVGGAAVLNDVCGTVNIASCNGDTRVGVVYDRTLMLTAP